MSLLRVILSPLVPLTWDRRLARLKLGSQTALQLARYQPIGDLVRKHQLRLHQLRRLCGGQIEGALILAMASQDGEASKAFCMALCLLRNKPPDEPGTAPTFAKNDRLEKAKVCSPVL